MDSGEKWDDYMSAKKNKLKTQFIEECDKNHVKSDIFKGVSVFVNGYTKPPADELRKLLIDYGGVYHHYFEKGKTTFMVATTLPTAKIDALRNFKVIKPEWVLESIQAGKMLNYDKYLLLSDINQSHLTWQRSVVQANTIEDLPSTSNNSEAVSSNQTPSSCDLSHKLVQPNCEFKSNANRKTARDENFIEEFYSNSRLHHLSTMSMKLKAFVNDLRREKTDGFPGKDRLRRYRLSHNDGHSSEMGIWSNGEKCIMHIDMDCFFASVGIRSRPELKELPVAVSHAKRDAKMPNKNVFDEGITREPIQEDGKLISGGVFDSMSEIASCNYKAREFGIKNGMLVGRALKLCPQLNIIPYEFRAYEEVSYTFYKHIASYTLDIEAVSCDEMYVDCSEVLKFSNVDVLTFATILKKEILEKTGCTCTTGFGPNRLISRLATKIAKPNGQLYIAKNEVCDFMKKIPVSDIPGIGKSITLKLRRMGIENCEDMQKSDLFELQKEFGKKMGSILHKRSRGEDDSSLNFTHCRKSLSVDVNYGIRFFTEKDVDAFFEKLSLEIGGRLKTEGLQGKSITLKLMVKAKNAPNESAKFLGHGICDTITKTISLNDPTSNPSIISRVVMKITQDLKILPQVIRGVGIQISRLEMENLDKPSNQTMDKFIVKKEKIDEAPSNSLCLPVESEKKANTHSENFSLSETNDPESCSANPHKSQYLMKCNNASLFNYVERPPKKSESLYLGSFISSDDGTYTFSNHAPLSEIVHIIELWIMKNDDPQLSDVDILFSFVGSLVHKNDFESFNFVVDKLERFLASKIHVKWKIINSAFMKFVRYTYRKI